MWGLDACSTCSRVSPGHAIGKTRWQLASPPTDLRPFPRLHGRLLRPALVLVINDICMRVFSPSGLPRPGKVRMVWRQVIVCMRQLRGLPVGP